jgi:HEAT repeat protein
MFVGAAAAAAPPTTGPVTAWSQPVNGIAVRIEQGCQLVHSNGWYTGTIHVRIKNISDHQIAMSTPPESANGDYSVQISIDDRWEKLVADQPGEIQDPEFRALAAGDDMLCAVRLESSSRLRLAEAEKVVIDVPVASKPGEWSGHLETPAIADYIDPAAFAPLRQSLPMPKNIPGILRIRPNFGISGPPNPLPFDGYRSGYASLLTEMEMYPAPAVAALFDRLQVDSVDEQQGFFFAAVAAAHGSEDAVKVLSDRGNPSDWHAVEGRAAAIELALESGKAPDSIIDAAVDMLHDKRKISDPQSSSPESAVNLAYAHILAGLGGAKTRRATEALLKLAADEQQTPALLQALCATGDPRVEEKLMVVVRAGLVRDPADDPVTVGAVAGLAAIRSRAAVPLLLEHTDRPGVFEALCQIGDPAAIPVLEKRVQDVKSKSVPGLTERDDWRVDEIIVALAVMRPGNPIPRLRDCITDPAFGMYGRCDAVRLLGTLADPDAVPTLFKAIADDPDGFVVDSAIESLECYHSKSVILGLTALFGHVSERHNISKESYTAERFDDEIVKSLRSITGQSIGPDPKRWNDWWQKQGQFDPRFK